MYASIYNSLWHDEHLLRGGEGTPTQIYCVLETSNFIGILVRSPYKIYLFEINNKQDLFYMQLDQTNFHAEYFPSVNKMSNRKNKRRPLAAMNENTDVFGRLLVKRA